MFSDLSPNSKALSGSIAGIRIPDSAVCCAALAAAREVERSEVFLHSLRAFVFASLIGQYRRLAFDQELLFVATIMHDVGLNAQYRSADLRFEVDGANAARVLLVNDRRNVVEQNLVWDAVALHSTGSIARHKEPEVALANAGIVTDVHGVYLDGIEPSAVDALLAYAPRLNFVEVFLEELVCIARDKPTTTANTFVADVGYRLVPGFHLENFVDAFERDDFITKVSGVGGHAAKLNKDRFDVVDDCRRSRATAFLRRAATRSQYSYARAMRPYEAAARQQRAPFNVSLF